MGCVSSKTDINDRHPNIFQVTNVNEQGKPISPGKLQVTETELVFYQKGKKPTKWPLRSLRKYGFDIEVFSFECGRRCPTGHGIYAFKCRKAEQLFNVVQQYITGNINDELDALPISGIPQPATRRPNMTMTNNAQTEGYLNPIMSTTTITSSVTNNNSSTVRTTITHQINTSTSMVSRPGSVSSSNGPLSPSMLPISPPADTPLMLLLEHNNNKRYSLIPEPTYTNSNVIMENLMPPPPHYANIATGGGGAADAMMMESNHVYMNIDTKENQTKDAVPVLLTDLPEDENELVATNRHCYANIDAKDLEHLKRHPIICDPLYNNATPSTTLTNAPPETEDYKLNYIAVTEVNYAELDLDAANVAVSFADSISQQHQVPNGTGGGGGVSSNQKSVAPIGDSPKVEKKKSYATIDFQKTTALSQSINNTMMGEEEEGIRKTRHNSTINYNNSLSD